MRAPATALLLVCGLAAPAGAQTPGSDGLMPQGSAIFGGAEARGLGGRNGTLDLLVQVFGGYDDDVLADQSGRGGPSQERLTTESGGLATGVGASLTYSKPGLLFNRPQGKGDFRAWLDNTFRYYPGMDNLTGRYHRFGLQVSAPVSRKVTLYASPRADYSPRYSFEFLLPSSPVVDGEAAQPAFTPTTAADLDYSIVANNSFRYAVNGGAEIKFGPRTSLSLDSAYTKRNSDIAAFAMEVWSAGFGFDHRVSDNASLELGYDYVDGSRGTGLATTIHNVDVGVDYRRPLSRTRRTFLSFNTGSTIAESEVSGRRIQAIGAASLVHYFQRTWSTLFEYRRRAHYVDGFDRPLFGNAFTSGVSGMLSRRMELAARVSYTSGSVGLSANAPQFDSFTGSLRLRRALSRRLAGYAETLFYHYKFDEAAPRPPGLPPTFDRLAFRCGVTWWIPVLH